MASRLRFWGLKTVGACAPSRLACCLQAGTLRFGGAAICPIGFAVCLPVGGKALPLCRFLSLCMLLML